MGTNIKKMVEIDLQFDCTPPEGSELTPWDIGKLAIDRIEAFLANEPEGSDAQERMNTKNSQLTMRVVIPVPDMAYATVIETKLVNNISTFPPEVPNTQRFNYSRIPVTTPDEEE